MDQTTQPIKKIMRVHPPVFKAQVALAAIRGEKTLAELASLYSVHTTQIKQWKDIAVDGIADLFSGARKNSDREKDDLTAALYGEIGRLKMELDWLKKKVGLTSGH